jgi:hypothetical protein
MAAPGGWPADWIVPDWPAPAGVHAVFTTRTGGVSAPPFDSFNLGDHVQDDPAAVTANRARLSEVVGARPVFLRQVHGTAVARLDARTPDGTEADACLATAPGQACTIMVADCLPLLFTDRSGAWVAAAHAGWRGLAGTQGRGVIETTLEAARGLAGTFGRGDILAWLGPCIGPAAFEVGPEVQAAFCAHDPAAQACFQPAPGPGKFLADLPALARQRLRAQGVLQVHGNDGSPAWCTVRQESRFFSHRRDAIRLGSTGRMAACIWLG